MQCRNIASRTNGQDVCIYGIRAYHIDITGASAASPTLVDKTKICLYIYFIYIYIYIYDTCVFRTYIYIHPAPFVRDAIFPHCMLVHVTTVGVAQGTRLAGQKG